MNYQTMKKQELLEKISVLKKRIQKLEQLETERRQAKKKLMNSEEKLRTLTEDALRQSEEKYRNIL